MADDIDELLREVEEKYLPRQTLQEKSRIVPHQPANVLAKKQQINVTAIVSSSAGSTAATTGKTTTRAHSSDIVCRELEDELSDLLDDDGRMSDAATVGLRCKRSPRRSASARELLVNVDLNQTSDSSQATGVHNPIKRGLSGGSVSNSTQTGAGLLGHRSAPPGVHLHRHTTDMKQDSSAGSAIVEKQKCFPIYLSGVIDSIEAVQAVRVCTSLRCMGCDFRVSQFAHYRWRPGTDYLFLRNHMPEFDRVRVKLAAAKFCRAYACQCKFVTVKDLVDLSKLGPEFSTKWICLGH